MTRDRETVASPTAVLGARLAHDLAALARIELETAMKARGARLRPLRRELVLALLGVCSLMAVVLFCSVACLRLLQRDMRAWLAALTVALGWLIVAVAAMRPVVRAATGWVASQGTAAQAG